MKLSIFAFVTLVIFCELCSSQVRINEVSRRNKEFIKLIQNACITIYSWDDMHFCFKNGKYNNGEDDAFLTDPEYFVITRFSSDTLDYGIVPMVEGGRFPFILLFVYKNKRAVQLACADIIDSTGHSRFESVRVAGDTVFVEVDDYPHVTDRFLFRDNKLIELKNK
jgi:hypothetical protein